MVEFFTALQKKPKILIASCRITRRMCGLTAISNIMNQENQQTENQSAPESAGARQFQSFSDAVDTARRNATERAREAAPKVKEAFSGAAFDLAYGAAFGACFAAAFAQEFVPGFVKESMRSVKAGLRQGKQAGTTAGQQQADDVKEAVASEQSQTSYDGAAPDAPAYS